MSRTGFTSVLVLTIVIFVSQTLAKPQSEHDPLVGIQTEHSNIEAQETFPRNTSTLFSDTTSSPRKRVSRAVQNRYVLTPGVGRHVIHSHARTWHEARKICQEEGGDLAVINSQAESQALAELMVKSYPHYDSDWDECVLVGFNDLAQKGEWVTIDGRTLEEAGFAEWSPGEPNNHKLNEDCGCIRKDGKLNDMFCDKKYAFACELPLVDKEPSPVSNVPQDVTTFTEDAYTYAPGIGTHKIIRHAETWQNARKICQKEGGDLAVINSEDEARAVGRLLDKSQPHFDSADSNYVLIGFNDTHHEGKYVTVDGRSLKEAGYEKWAPGEPNDAGRNEDSGSIDNKGRLNDMPCSRKYAFVCELNIILDPEDIQDGRTPSTVGNTGIPDPAVVSGAQGSRSIKGVTILFMCSLYLLVTKTFF